MSVEDAYGNVVTTDDSYVTLAIATDPACEMLNGTVCERAASGVAAFSDISAFSCGGCALKATDGTLAPATSDSFNVTAQGETQYQFGTVGTQKGVTAHLTAADGTVATFSMSGAGTGTVTVVYVIGVVERRVGRGLVAARSRYGGCR